MKRDKKIIIDATEFTEAFPGAIIGSIYEKEEPTKEIHDSYRVFVNGDYIGDKVLLGQNEEVSELNDYLKNNSFTNYSTLVDGNRYFIKEKDREQAHKMKDNLQTYLSIR
ncbi:hypothetical protein [Clostridium sp. DL1XJH146]